MSIWRVFVFLVSVRACVLKCVGFEKHKKDRDKEDVGVCLVDHQCSSELAEFLNLGE